MVQNRGLEGVWGCSVVCLRPKAPVGRFLDASGAALGLGGSWRILGASWVTPGLSWAPSWGALGRLEVI